MLQIRPIFTALCACLIISLLCPLGLQSQSPNGGGSRAAASNERAISNGDLCTGTDYPVIFTQFGGACETSLNLQGVQGSSTTTIVQNGNRVCRCRIWNYHIGYTGTLPTILSITLNGVDVTDSISINTANKTISIPTPEGETSKTIVITYDCSLDQPAFQFGGYHTVIGGGLCIVVDLGGTYPALEHIEARAIQVNPLEIDSAWGVGTWTGLGLAFNLPLASSIGIETEVRALRGEFTMPELGALPFGLEPLVITDSTSTAVNQYSILLGPKYSFDKQAFSFGLNLKGGLVFSQMPALQIGIGRPGESVHPDNLVFASRDVHADMAISTGIDLGYHISRHWTITLGGGYFQTLGRSTAYEWRDFSNALQDPDLYAQELASEPVQQRKWSMKSYWLSLGIRYQYSLCR